MRGDKSCHVVRYMLERAGVPENMWGKSVRFLVERKLLNAKQFCDVCPMMRKKGRLRPIPRSYWPDSRSRFGPRILYTKNVEDIVEKFLFPFMYEYDYRGRRWKRFWLGKYIKLIGPRVGVCPRRLLLKPIFSRRYKRKSDGKVVFYNFWLYHGGLIVLAPYELALKIARIAYHVRKGKKILLIVDEADALFFKKNYVPVFPPEASRREFEVAVAFIRFFVWLKGNQGAEFNIKFRKFKETVGRVVRRKDVFLRGLLCYVLSNYDAVRSALMFFVELLSAGWDGSGGLFEYMLERGRELSYRFAGLVSLLREDLSEFRRSLSFFDDVYSKISSEVHLGLFDALRLWNSLFVLCGGGRDRMIIVEGKRVERVDR